jgi:hydroxyacylglutathione hydrolase
MLFRKITSEILSHNSYLIGSRGVAAVIDPRRDCDVYIDCAEKNQIRITHIFETHRNEDYAVGSCELSARCGAGIYHGSAVPFEYGNPAREGDRFGIGDFLIEVMETPGHTPESLSFVLRENGSKIPMMVFTGDTLFAGDVGRTDLLGHDRAAEAAGALWDSLSGKILPLGDGVIVCPAHGAGSVCGGEISDREYTTIGYERENNPLCAMARPKFIALKTVENHYIPPYFAMMERLNLSGPPPARMLPALPALSPSDVASFAARGAQILDIRSPTAFGAGHIPGSLSVWRDGLPAWMGWVLDYERPVILVDDFNVGLDRVARHFTRLGYDNLAGFLSGGFPAWFREARPVGQIRSLSVQQLHAIRETGELFLLDVRDIRNREQAGEIPGSAHIYAGELPARTGEVPKDRDVVVYCDAGFKGALAASILAMNGFPRVANLLGGISAWKAARYEIARVPASKARSG